MSIKLPRLSVNTPEVDSAIHKFTPHFAVMALRYFYLPNNLPVEIFNSRLAPMRGSLGCVIWPSATPLLPSIMKATLYAAQFMNKNGI